MGYSTFFTGAVRIIPKPSPETFVKINMFLSMRHCKTLETVDEYRRLLTHKAWKPDGPAIMDPAKIIEETRNSLPNIKDWPIERIAPFVDGDPTPTFVYNNMPANFPKDYSTELFPGLSLYSDIRLYPGDDCAYLAWDQSEKAYDMDKWFGLILGYLKSAGFDFDGVVHAQGEDYDDRWTIVAKDGSIDVVPGFIKEPTYDDVVFDNPYQEMIES